MFMRYLVTAIALAGALALAGAATAAPPNATTESGTGPYGPTCGSEDIMATYVVTRTLKITYDGSTPVLFRSHESFSGTLWLASTGKSVPYSGALNAVFDPATSIVTITGRSATVVLPGSGIIYQNSGIETIDWSAGFPPAVSWKGPADGFAPGGLDALCSALGA
jgi:hypothetical protein